MGNKSCRQGRDPAPGADPDPLRREMKGRFGTGKETDKTATRWAEFFTNIEAARGPVRDARSLRLRPAPPEAYFLTSQTMRVVTEPPPPGSARELPVAELPQGLGEAYATDQGHDDPGRRDHV